MGNAEFDFSSDQKLTKSQNPGMSLENDLHRNQYDDLTGLPTLGCFFQNAGGIIRDLRKQGKTPAIIWLDLSGFHDYQALFGFETGDVLLRGLSVIIRDRFGAENAARFNSDYFIVCTESEHVEEALRQVFAEALKLNQGNSRPVAAGIYVCEDENVVLSAAIDRAKLACDSLHDPMHSSFAYFDQEMLERANLRQYILHNYQKAMAEGWIKVYYQPVIRTVTGRLCGAEALARWEDPVHGMISPGQFIPALEEGGLICELDLYMIERVCQDGRKVLKEGGDLVPVSVNLSRKDFREPDLVEKIEALANKYEIPRELLNIEITESAFIKHPERLSRNVTRFHELGFQVWMDDFGTAYSSLGSLKELEFDELKIDMSFLSSSTDKARSIITSIVRMAKEIGIQTLAEGVETKEQYEFLKQIGCEKIQGYYFGKPMDKAAFASFCRGRKLEAEQLCRKNYYDALGRINYQTDEPLCVIEDDGNTLHLLFANEAYREVLRRDHINDIDEWIDEINEDNNPAHTFHRKYADEQLRKLTGTQVITYPSGDHYMELTGKVTTRYENLYIYSLNIRYIQLNTTSEDQRKAFYIQYMYYLCDDIAIFDLEKNTLFGLKSTNSSQPIGVGGRTVDLKEAFRIYSEKYIYPADRERYHSFLDPETLKSRMRGKKGQDLTGLFRCKAADNEYHLMLHLIMPIPKSGFNRYLTITLPVDSDASFREFLLYGERENQNDKPAGSDGITPATLWRNLEAYSDGMYFWKDMNRRFIGASRSFLDYYGFGSVKEILGKTDEDMGWHVEPNAFMKDELDVLQNGSRVLLAKGKCIARGKQRTILASKIPIYRDGKIVGLMGSFFDAENLTCFLNDKYQAVSIDEVTDLFNARGIYECQKDYLEALWTSNTEFAVIHVSIPEYLTFRNIYGDEAGNKLLHSIGKVLRDITGKEGSIGRITGSCFTILMQDVQTGHIQTTISEIQEKISKLRRVGEWTCALTAQVQVSVLNQNNASRENYAKSLDHMLLDAEDYQEKQHSRG